MFYSSKSLTKPSRIFVGEAHFYYFYSKEGGKFEKEFLFEKLYHTDLSSDSLLNHVEGLERNSSPVTSFARVPHHFTSLDTNLVYNDEVFRTYIQSPYDRMYVDQTPAQIPETIAEVMSIS